MKLPEPPTVIMLPDDFAALGAMRKLEAMNLRIPEDVSITGYDGIQLFQMMRPKLTTYYQDAEAIGRKSARKLIETIEDPENATPEQLMVQGKLLYGNTVKDLRT